MRKVILDLTVKSSRQVSPTMWLMRFVAPADSKIPRIGAGQFAQILVPDSPTTFLRRPISVFSSDAHSLTMLIREAGEGTRHLVHLPEGKQVNMILPLGNSFTIPEDSSSRVLLVGGGVGMAPMICLATTLKMNGFVPAILLAGRSAPDVIFAKEYCETWKLGEIFISTDDGSLGHPGVATVNPVMQQDFGKMFCCGPTPMMKAVAAIAREKSTECEVSLENMMGCGIGACLCCVEKTVRGNVCVCTEGPVFNIKELTW